LFNKMKDHANKITWGGYARCYGVNSSPPMGNGKWPGKSSAIDSDRKKCYQASPFMNSMFYYGGPGGCTN
ncbi:hypothetical protein BAE44_0004200, partial [Dichanthelium oligosanthes]